MNNRPQTMESHDTMQGLARFGSLLLGLQDETAVLKTRLAEAILNCDDCDQLDSLEDFQARFIAKDTVIALLRRELATLAATTNGERNFSPETNVTYVKLGTDLLKMKDQLQGLKDEFETYLAATSSLIHTAA